MGQQGAIYQTWLPVTLGVFVGPALFIIYLFIFDCVGSLLLLAGFL